MDEAKEVEKLRVLLTNIVEMLSHEDSEERTKRFAIAESLAIRSTLRHLIAKLGDADSGVRGGACFVLGKLGNKSAVPALVEALGDTAGKVRQTAAEALGELGDASALPKLLRLFVNCLDQSDQGLKTAVARSMDKLVNNSAVPYLIKALGDSDQRVRVSAGIALKHLGVEEPAKLELNLHKDAWPKAMEFTQHTIELNNKGAGLAFDLHLSLYGPAVGDKVSLALPELPPGEKVSRSISIRPEAPGSAVPLHWELTYDDIKGPNQKLEGTLYLVVEGAATHPTVTIGTLVGGSVDGPVIGKVTSQVAKPFTICPYCGEELKLSKTPRFCPYCKEKLAVED